jgi:hypothetical protein
LVGVRTRDMVSDADFFKERMKFLIFTTPICLHGKDFAIKKTFHKRLELMKFFKHL